MKRKEKIHTIEDFKRMTTEPQGKSGNKYNAVPMVVDAITHDSQHEGNLALHLRHLLMTGYIKNLRLQKCELKYQLKVNDVHIAIYEADAKFDVVKNFEFRTMDGFRQLFAGETHVVDAKSAPTRKKAEYRMKRDLMLALHDIRILEF